MVRLVRPTFGRRGHRGDVGSRGGRALRILEFGVALLLAAGGVRSIVRWSGRRIEATAASHHVLYALFLTGRIGMWFALAGMLVILGFASDPESLRWYVMIPMVLAAVSLASGLLLGRSAD